VPQPASGKGRFKPKSRQLRESCASLQKELLVHGRETTPVSVTKNTNCPPPSVLLHSFDVFGSRFVDVRSGGPAPFTLAVHYPYKRDGFLSVRLLDHSSRIRMPEKWLRQRKFEFVAAPKVP
ncbi:hypothetical protein BDZ89DRAFT_1233202, partial [Hymenopellis radicata]